MARVRPFPSLSVSFVLVACGAPPAATQTVPQPEAASAASAELEADAAVNGDSAPDAQAMAYDSLPVVRWATAVQAANTPGSPVRVERSRSFRARGVRVHIEEPRLPSARARAVIHRALASFFERSIPWPGETRSSRIACRALLAQTNLVSYLCSSHHVVGDEGIREHTFETMTFAIDGDLVRVIADDELVDLSSDEYEDLVCRASSIPRESCWSDAILLGVRRDGIQIFLVPDTGSPPVIPLAMPFEAFGWLIDRAGVLARIPGAVDRADRMPIVIDASPDDAPALDDALVQDDDVEPVVLLGASSPLEELVRRTEVDDGPARIGLLEGGAYQAFVSWGAALKTDFVRDVPTARAAPPDEASTLSIVPGVLRQRLALRDVADDTAPVSRILPPGTLVKVVLGRVGDTLSDVATPGAFVYVVAGASAGFVSGEIDVRDPPPLCTSHPVAIAAVEDEGGDAARLARDAIVVAGPHAFDGNAITAAITHARGTETLRLGLAITDAARPCAPVEATTFEVAGALVDMQLFRAIGGSASIPIAFVTTRVASDPPTMLRFAAYTPGRPTPLESATLPALEGSVERREQWEATPEVYPSQLVHTGRDGMWRPINLDLVPR